MAIICGPIVRHTDRSQLNIWLVTDEAVQSSDLLVYESNTFTSNIAANIAQQSIQLGTSCYAVMLTADIQPSANCERIFYDAVINNNGFRETGLNTLICLDSDPLPSVAIPNTHRHICQASCRKPHDPEAIDQLAALAGVLAEHYEQPSRPSQLYLTGDQIYADDVSPILLQSFEGVRAKLGLAHETMYTANDGAFDPDKFNLDTRDKKATSSSGFTSGQKDSHLLSFAEYLCMYLFTFAGMLPGQRFASHRVLKDRLSFKQYKNGKRIPKQYKFNAALHKQESRVLGHFADTVSSKVRKLLANISVYMIFDDHDVTDDWNLNQKNYTNLTTSTLGKQVYVNALSAYLICQHWGNRPDEVEAQLRNQVQALALDPSRNHHTSLESLFGKYWGYILEQTPPAVVLDTRTQRVYNGDELKLMSLPRLAALGNELSGLPTTPSLILVSPTPAYGFTSIEAMQLQLPKNMQSAFDREPWIASKEALKALQSAVMKTPGVKHVTILSGDVHYAFSRRQQLDGSDVTFWQFCSSAACNSPAGGNIGLPLINFLGQHFEKEHTKYLLPKGEKKHFLTSDKNVGTLTFNDTLIPVEARLLCANSSGEPYSKIYDLVNYVEYPQ